MALPNVQVEDTAAVSKALEWTVMGLDFTDALHLASRGESREFVTFDGRLVKRAKKAEAGAVALLGAYAS